MLPPVLSGLSVMYGGFAAVLPGVFGDLRWFCVVVLPGRPAEVF